MLAMALSLAGLGLADLIGGGLAGRVTSKRRVIAGAAIVAALQLLNLIASDWAPRTIAYSTVFTAGVVTWMLLRRGDPSERRAGGSAAFLVGLLGLVVLGGPGAPGTLPTRVRALWADHPSDVFASHSTEEILLYLAILMVLTATANAFVRTVLHASGTRLESSETTLRGGRLIGVIERWLIYVLVSGGAPTAAALVVSAKSLVRFPELNTARQANGVDADGAREIDYVTEYFLLGSMLSWSSAVVAVLMLP